MDNVTSFLERSKDFEQAHYTCREILEERINKIENYVSKWILIAIGVMFLFMIASSIYLNYKINLVKKRVDYRYFLLEESLEEIHSLNLDKGKVIRNY